MLCMTTIIRDPEPWSLMLVALEKNPRGRVRREAELKPGWEPCCLCGRGVNRTKPFLEAVVVEGNLAFGDENSDPADAGYMGYYPVGSNCARVLRRAGVPLYPGKVLQQEEI